MLVEQNNDKILIEVDASLFSLEEMQKFTNYLRSVESNAKNQGTQEQADELARESQKDWWTQNRQRFIK